MENKEFVSGNQKKLTFGGKTQSWPSYLIPVSDLYYNNQNGRISTYISENEEREKRSVLSIENIEEYNDLLAEMITDSSGGTKRLKKTLDSIKLEGQKEVGVVTSDGRIIDGNRRFTCLRKLYKETGDPRFGFFEAVIIPSQSDASAIKILEMELQDGIDDRVDYDPIDRLTSFYKDVVENELYNEKIWCRINKKSSKEYKLTYKKAEIMKEYLEFINKPTSFYIAKDLKLDGPIQEIANFALSNDILWKKNKREIFGLLYMKPQGDPTRFIRPVLKSFKKATSDELMEVYKYNIEEKVFNSIEAGETSFNAGSPEETYEIKKTIADIVSAEDRKSSIDDFLKEPLKKIQAASKSVTSIKKEALDNIGGSNRREFLKACGELKKEVQEIINYLEKEEE